MVRGEEEEEEEVEGEVEERSGKERAKRSVKKGRRV